jgi:hypothetical protein
MIASMSSTTQLFLKKPWLDGVDEQQQDNTGLKLPTYLMMHQTID